MQTKIKNSKEECDKAKAEFTAASKAFAAVKDKRRALFMDMFACVSACIEETYKDLTRSTKHPMGGSAYLSLEDDGAEPYLGGINFTAMPPTKRFRGMEHLSGGEKVGCRALSPALPRLCLCFCLCFCICLCALFRTVVCA